MEERKYLKLKQYPCLCTNTEKCLICKFETNKITKQFYDERMKDVSICYTCKINLYCEKHQGCRKNIGNECEIVYNWRNQYNCKNCK